MNNYFNDIKSYIGEEQKVLSLLSNNDINDVINILEEARLSDHRIFICGNGGSASTASHMAGDFKKGVNQYLEKKYEIECLSDNLPSMLAMANDISYDDIFVFPLMNRISKGDVLIGISGSGNSANVIKAIEYATEMGAETVSFTGYDGGKLKEISRHNIHVPIDNMQIVEDVHLVLNHMMMYILSQEHKKDV